MNNQQPENVIHNQLVTLSKNLNMTNVDTNQMCAILRETAFKNANDAQLAALMVVANQYGLNPFIKEIYAFPSRGAITPIVSVDGWARITNNHPMLDGIQFEQDAESATCKIYRKDRAHPTVVTEYLSECRMNTDVWKKYPKRMLRHKAFIQCARIAFGFSGIYDEDEAQRIEKGIDAQATRIIDTQAPDDGYIEFYNEMQPNLAQAAAQGMDALSKAYSFLISLDNKDYAKRLWTEQGADLKMQAQQADITKTEQENIIDAEVVEGESIPAE